MISTLRSEQSITANHQLKSQDKHDQQARMEQGTIVTHQLESQGQA